MPLPAFRGLLLCMGTPSGIAREGTATEPHFRLRSKAWNMKCCYSSTPFFNYRNPRIRTHANRDIHAPIADDGSSTSRERHGQHYAPRFVKLEQGGSCHTLYSEQGLQCTATRVSRTQQVLFKKLPVRAFPDRHMTHKTCTHSNADDTPSNNQANIKGYGREEVEECWIVCDERLDLAHLFAELRRCSSVRAGYFSSSR